MKPFSRELAYKKNLVFLLCDFYEDKAIPRNMYEVTDNLTLLPINNHLLIDYILQNLMEQNCYNIVLVGNKIRSVIKHVKNSKFHIQMNISYLSNDQFESNRKYIYNLDNSGDFFRTLMSFNVRSDFMVIHANQYTNFNLILLKNFHIMNKAHITLFIFEKETNDPDFYHYDFSRDGRLFDVAKNDKKIVTGMKKYNDPGTVICSVTLCELFNEFPDARSLIQLIEELKSTFCFGNFKFMVINEDVIMANNIDHRRPQNSSDGGGNARVSQNMDTAHSTVNPTPNDDEYQNLCVDAPLSIETIVQLANMLKETKCISAQECLLIEEYEKNLLRVNDDIYYINLEINTLMDYIKLCQCLGEIADEFFGDRRLTGQTINSTSVIISTPESEWDGSSADIISKLSTISVSAVSMPELAIIAGPDSDKTQEYYIELPNGEMLDCRTIEYDLFKYEDSEESENRDSFFEECIDYLKKKLFSEDRDIAEISKNITLFKIYWNTTTEEVLEAYACFFVEIISELDQINMGYECNNTTEPSISGTHACSHIHIINPRVTNIISDGDSAEQETCWERVDDVICAAAHFFGLIVEESAYDLGNQDYFVQCLFNNVIDELQGDLKFKVFYSYCYLLKSCKVIDKNIIKRYKKEMKMAEQEDK